jgi:hypothetical protein
VIHTVLVSSDRDRITRGPVTYSGPGQYPDPILGPLFQLVQHETRVIQFDNLGLGVGATALDDLQPVVGDPSVGTFSSRWFPRYQYGGRADRFAGYIARRSPGDCITLSYRRGKKKKQNSDCGSTIGSYRSIVPDFGSRHQNSGYENTLRVSGIHFHPGTRWHYLLVVPANYRSLVKS